MIRYTLRCAQGHEFESWFQSATAFDSLVASRALACIDCGATDVTKSLMSPAVAATAPLRGPPSARAQAIEALRREVMAKSDDVGRDFVAEARRIHAGDVPERAIHGEARLDEARALIEEGVPVMPLPFLPARKVN